ncbi:MAG: hypothetical protein V4510_05110 [bacterium]
MRTGGFLLALALAFAAVSVPHAGAQAPAGAIYFGSTLKSTVTANAACPEAVFENHYEATTTAPPAGTAAAAASYGADSCYNYWDYTATQDFTFTGDITIHALLGCTAAWAAIEVDGHVYLDGTEISNSGDPFVLYLPPATCIPGGSVQVDIPVVGSAGTEVRSGQIVSTGIIVFSENPPSNAAANNIVIMTGATTSALTATGIPGAVQAVGGEALDLVAAKTSASAPPGESGFYNLTVKNLGAATKFTMSTVGLPNGYTAAFNPLTGDIAKDASTPTVLKVTISSTATGGTHVPFKVKVTSTAGANKTVDVSIDVIKTAPPPTTGPSGGPSGDTTQPATTTDDNGFTREGDTGGSSKASPGIEFALNVLAVALVVLARRRQP